MIIFSLFLSSFILTTYFLLNIWINNFLKKLLRICQGINIYKINSMHNNFSIKAWNDNFLQLLIKTSFKCLYNIDTLIILFFSHQVLLHKLASLSVTQTHRVLTPWAGLENIGLCAPPLPFCQHINERVQKGQYE